MLSEPLNYESSSKVTQRHKALCLKSAWPWQKTRKLPHISGDFNKVVLLTPQSAWDKLIHELDSWEALEVHVQAEGDKNSHYVVKIREGIKDLQLLGTGLSHGTGETGTSLCSLGHEMHR